MMCYFCIDRHRRAVNLAFLDGHAENVRLEDLWKQQWNADFTTKDVNMP
jgi:prepilin-type processing-associated H-X9-DG protein